MNPKQVTTLQKEQAKKILHTAAVVGKISLKLI